MDISYTGEVVMRHEQLKAAYLEQAFGADVLAQLREIDEIELSTIGELSTQEFNELNKLMPVSPFVDELCVEEASINELFGDIDGFKLMFTGDQQLILTSFDSKIPDCTYCIVSLKVTPQSDGTYHCKKVQRYNQGNVTRIKDIKVTPYDKLIVERALDRIERLNMWLASQTN